MIDQSRRRSSVPARGTQTNSAGRGPTGYRRSDARITEDVSDGLTELPVRERGR